MSGLDVEHAVQKCCRICKDAQLCQLCWRSRVREGLLPNTGRPISSGCRPESHMHRDPKQANAAECQLRQRSHA